MRRQTYDERREAEYRDYHDQFDRGPGQETDDEKLERWRRGWANEIERDLEKGF